MGEIRVDNKQLQSVKLPINLMRQGSQFVIYTPALDICTSGDTKEQAFANFNDMVHIFLNDLIEQDTLDEVLEELGWECTDSEWVPPAWECNQYQSIEMPRYSA